MSKWKEEYLKKLNMMYNEEILDEYTSLAGGDTYDGCYTQRGEWMWEEIQKEFKKRLIDVGYISEN
jgi:hypothetical protein